MTHRTGLKHRIEHPRDLIVTMMDRVYRYGMTTTSGGNVSLLDEDGSMWLTPGGVDKGSLTRNDIICVKADGTVEGRHKPSSEYPFHRAIYNARPDVKAVVHGHPPALVSFSAVRIPVQTRVTPNAWLVCGDCPVVPYAAPGSEELGTNIAAQFAKGSNVVLLENHGTVTVGTDIFEAFMRFETLDFCARLQIKATGLGPIRTLSDDEIARLAKKSQGFQQFERSSYTTGEKDLRREMAILAHRAYDQQLATSTEGTISVCIDSDSFLITPYGYDRKLLEPADMVLVQEGKVESAKSPSRSFTLHQEIYERHPHIGAIVIAHPPSIMAFAVTHTDFDSRVIPESYILLRDTSQLPYGTPYTDHDAILDTLGPATPNLIVRNDSLIVTGSSLLEAFDRLEVAEFTATSVVAAKSLGRIVSMDDATIHDLEQAFDLPPATEDTPR